MVDKPWKPNWITNNASATGLHRNLKIKTETKGKLNVTLMFVDVIIECVFVFLNLVLSRKSLALLPCFVTLAESLIPSEKL